MILEWLETKITPATSLAKKYRLVYHSVALRHRYQRCEKSWAPHIENCRSLIRETIERLPQRQHLIILGSAHLHEVPRDLLVTFHKVTLIDLVHPLGVRRWARSFPQIHLLEQDLSGFLARLENFNQAETLLQEFSASAPAFAFDADLIISSNLISQLHLIALDYLERKKIAFPDDYPDRLGQAFSQSHLQALHRCKGEVLLYGDRETIYRDRQGQEIYRGHFAIDLSQFQFLRQWQWEIAPLGEFSRKESIEMSVEAYCRRS